MTNDCFNDKIIQNSLMSDEFIRNLMTKSLKYLMEDDCIQKSLISDEII